MYLFNPLGVEALAGNTVGKCKVFQKTEEQERIYAKQSGNGVVRERPKPTRLIPCFEVLVSKIPDRLIMDIHHH